MTFTFSDRVRVDDLTVVGGTVTDLKTTDGGKTGTFTPTPGFEGTASVTQLHRSQRQRGHRR
ncbi:Ig-like domain-containing protein [Aeromonas caviae]|uniref:Ig-like domain-containing protein n=1 Tax=Aeromonas caviae TaxID=648 RepID=UPI003890258B